MAGRPSIGLRFEQRLFQQALADFRSRVSPEIARAGSKKLALDVVSTTVRALNGPGAGFSNPKRIDTGRYRAAWQATEGALAPGPGVGVSVGDSSVAGGGSGPKFEIAISNAVEYGPYVEYGTSKMAPGLHLQTGLRTATKSARAVVGALVAKGWNAP